jgi:hypothetical protein
VAEVRLDLDVVRFGLADAEDLFQRLDVDRADVAAVVLEQEVSRSPFDTPDAIKRGRRSSYRIKSATDRSTASGQPRLACLNVQTYGLFLLQVGADESAADERHA